MAEQPFLKKKNRSVLEHDSKNIQIECFFFKFFISLGIFVVFPALFFVDLHKPQRRTSLNSFLTPFPFPAKIDVFRWAQRLNWIAVSQFSYCDTMQSPGSSSEAYQPTSVIEVVGQKGRLIIQRNLYRPPFIKQRV